MSAGTVMKWMKPVRWRLSPLAMLVALLVMLAEGALLLSPGDCWAADTAEGMRAAGEKCLRGHAGRGSGPAGGHGRPGCPGRRFF